MDIKSLTEHLDQLPAQLSEADKTVLNARLRSLGRGGVEYQIGITDRNVREFDMYRAAPFERGNPEEGDTPAVGAAPTPTSPCRQPAVLALGLGALPRPVLLAPLRCHAPLDEVPSVLSSYVDECRTEERQAGEEDAAL